jgi:fructose-1,6-bisphosphatase I
LFVAKIRHHNITTWNITMTPQRQRPQLQAKMSFTSLLFLLFIPTISSFTSNHPPLSSFPLYSASFTADAQETPSDAAAATAAAADSTYFQIPSNPILPHRSTSQRITLTRYLSNVVKEHPEVSSSTCTGFINELNFMHPPVHITVTLHLHIFSFIQLRDLESLLLSVQMACKTISNLVNRAGLVYGSQNGNAHGQDGRFYSMKRLDQLSTEVLRNSLKFTGKCQMVAPAVSLKEETPAEHQPGVLIATALDSNYIACLDPLDGSGNADASICTGTVFGVFENPQSKFEASAVLQAGEKMRAAGYCLYSSATVLVIALGDGCGVQGFTLDPSVKEFVLTHPNLTIPARGSVYSCNEANAEGWSDEFREYLRNLKTGKNEMKQPYAHRYVGSMVGDIHRTLLYGGIFCYPSDTLQHPHGNIQLLYKTAPMAFVVHQAGGKCMDETTGNLLQVQPKRIHQKSPCFIGSPDDVEECKTYLQKNLSKRSK